MTSPIKKEPTELPLAFLLSIVVFCGVELLFVVVRIFKIGYHVTLRFGGSCRVTGVTGHNETSEKIFENEVENHRYGKHDIFVYARVFGKLAQNS